MINIPVLIQKMEKTLMSNTKTETGDVSAKSTETKDIIIDCVNFTLMNLTT